MEKRHGAPDMEEKRADVDKMEDGYDLRPRVVCKRRRLSLEELKDACSFSSQRLPCTFSKAMKTMILQAQMLRGRARDQMLDEMRSIIDEAAQEAQHCKLQEHDNNLSSFISAAPQVHANTAGHEAPPAAITATSPKTPAQVDDTMPCCDTLLAPSCGRCQWLANGCLCAVFGAKTIE